MPSSVVRLVLSSTRLLVDANPSSDWRPNSRADSDRFSCRRADSREAAVLNADVLKFCIDEGAVYGCETMTEMNKGGIDLVELGFFSVFDLHPALLSFPKTERNVRSHPYLFLAKVQKRYLEIDLLRTRHDQNLVHTNLHGSPSKAAPCSAHN
jgi:hypothetical protein